MDLREYYSKIKTADEAVKPIKSGDIIEYGEFTMCSRLLDAALARRVKQLKNVSVRGTCIAFVPEIIKADPTGEHFAYSDWHLSVFGRKLSDKGLCHYVPMNYHEGPDIIRNQEFGRINAGFIMVSPPDKDGYVNLGPSSSVTPALIKTADYIAAEVNTSVPLCYAKDDTKIHISDIDCFVLGDNEPLMELPNAVPDSADKRIAETVVKEIKNGACIQLGIGGLPNAVGSMIAEAGLRDLGIHAEMLCDSCVDMYEAGCVSGKYKAIDKGRTVYTFAMGSKKLYDFLDGNPDCLIAPADYTNDPYIIAKNDNMICINNALEVDLYGQVSSESSGTRQISGTGGQLDFTLGAAMSKGGKGFICLSSSYFDANGTRHSRIKPFLSHGTIVTVPRSVTRYVVTEYGIADLRAKNTLEKAEALINIAHPAFREELIMQAYQQGLKIRANKA